jgi:predicted transposase YbfD/YdcC
LSKKNVETIIESENDYVIVVKKNQAKLHKAIEEQRQTKVKDRYYWIQKGHGHETHCRIETWTAPQQMASQWKGLSTVICVNRKGKRKGKSFNHDTYYIASQSQSAYCFSKVIRGHRLIENALHWTKDVILNEDKCQIVPTMQSANLGLIRNISFNLLKMEGIQSISEGIAYMGENVNRLWNIISQSFKKIHNFI